MLRDDLTQALKEAMKARDQRAVSTVRMILAGLKDRDIEARGKGNATGIADGEIAEMLQKMIRQREESRDIYAKAGRADLAQQEGEEIVVINRYLPKQIDDAEMGGLIDSAIAESGAAGIKDMGKVMALLKERYSGRMAFAKAGALVKQKLG
jgi:uncharacterized protein YqeY